MTEYYNNRFSAGPYNNKPRDHHYNIDDPYRIGKPKVPYIQRPDDRFMRNQNPNDRYNNNYMRGPLPSIELLTGRVGSGQRLTRPEASGRVG